MPRSPARQGSPGQPNQPLILSRMNLNGIENHLTQAIKNLMLDWQQTQAGWRDVKSEEFQRQYLENLPHHVARATAVITEINELLKKVRSDCG